MDAFVLGFIFATPVFLVVGYCCGLVDGHRGVYSEPAPRPSRGRKGCNE